MPARYDECPEIALSASETELTLTGAGFSFRWAAPEVLRDEEPGLASDVWALGWIMWEVSSPHNTIHNVEFVA